jgi:ABC-type antimicrobial peptide transport system permease subunit
MTISQLKEESVAPRRLNAALVSSFGLLAVLIAAVGIAGVLAFSVSARTTEIGIRMSLGADRSRVERMILKEGGVLVVMGVALGVGGAFYGARVIQGLLFGVEPRDPVTFAGVAVLMAAIGIVACWIPALRAARIDPAIAMRRIRSAGRGGSLRECSILRSSPSLISVRRIDSRAASFDRDDHAVVGALRHI